MRHMLLSDNFFMNIKFVDLTEFYKPGITENVNKECVTVSRFFADSISKLKYLGETSFEN